MGGDGPGCDGNCPPKNNLASANDPDEKMQSLPAGHYAFKIATPDGAISFDSVSVLSQLQSDQESTTATLSLWGVVPFGLNAGKPSATAPGGGTLSAMLDDPGDDGPGWWKADLSLSDVSGPFFLDFEYDGTLVLPVAAEDKSQGWVPQTFKSYYYRPGNSGPWTLRTNVPLPFAYKFACASTSSRPKGGINGQMLLGSTFDETLDDTWPTTIGFLWIGFVALPGIDLTFLGAPSCQLWVDISNGFGLAALTDAAGHAQFAIPLAIDPMSLGAQVHQQWFVYDPTVNPFGWIASNALRTTIH